MSLSGTRLEFVNTPELAMEFMEWLGQRRPILSIDTETKGLEWWVHKDFVRLVQFGDGLTGWTLSARNWRGLIEWALKKIHDNNTPVVFHNASFDMHALRHDGFTVPGWSQIDDTYIQHHLLYPDEWHGLKQISVKHIDYMANLGQMMLEKGMQRNKWTWETVPEEFEPYTLYAGADTVLTARAHEKFKPQVDSRFLVPYHRELAVREIMHKAEARGIYIDDKYSIQLREQYREEMSEINAQLREYGIENPNSRKQVEAALRDEGWEPVEFTDKGNPKMNEEVMSSLDSRVAPRVIRWKRLSKWSKAYLDKFIDLRDETGAVHPSINTLQAKTGRMSITGIPLQTLPKGRQIRRAITPREGYEMWAIDYANVELRLAAVFSKDPLLMAAFNEGLDMHDDLAQRAFGHTGGKYRKLAKNGRYASLYGAGPEKLSKTLKIPLEQAIAIQRGIDEGSPALRQYAELVQSTAEGRYNAEGTAYINTWGERIAVSEPDKTYKLLNFKIQGTAADIFKEAIVTMGKLGLDEYIVIPVHDENLLMVPKDGGKEIVHEIHKVMEFHDFSVPLTCDISGPGDSWAEWYPEDETVDLQQIMRDEADGLADEIKQEAIEAGRVDIDWEDDGEGKDGWDETVGA